MIRTRSEIVIGAAAPAVFAVASKTEHWPEFLPHYRYVRVIGRTAKGRVIEMAARRGWIPVRWRAEQTDTQETPSITFVHLRGWAKGMHVRWSFETDGSGTRVCIEHTLEPRPPLIGRWFTQVVIVGYFIEPIASKTLRCMKAAVEDRRAG